MTDQPASPPSESPDSTSETASDSSADSSSAPRADVSAPGWSPVQPPMWTAPSGYGPSGSAGPDPSAPPVAPGPDQPYGPGVALQNGPSYGAYAPPPQAPKPGIVPLRPLGLGEILDGAVAYIRANPRAVLGVSVVLAVATAAIRFLTDVLTWSSLNQALQDWTDSLGDGVQSPTTSADTGAQLSSSLLDLVSSGVGLLIGVIATGLFTILIGHAVLGRRISAGQAWSEARGRLLRLLGLTVLIAAATWGILLAGVLIAVVSGVTLGGVGVALGVLLVLVLIPVAIWLWVLWSLAAPTLMLERTGVIASMRRSMRLVRPAWWRIFGIELLAAIIGGIIATVVAIPFAVIGGVSLFTASDPTAIPWVYLVGSAIGTLVASIVVQPFSAGVTALLYVDQRIRREALDLVLLQAASTRPENVEQRF